MGSPFALILVALLAEGPAAGLRVPDGFAVAEFAGNDLASDIYGMTIDRKGRVVVSGRGWLRILADDDSDGRADRAIAFADEPADGAMGLLWEGETLYFVGDGGLRQLHDADGDDRADDHSELIRPLKTGGEHDAHAVRRGPDGWLYVLCGNSTGVGPNFVTGARSPITQPVAGCLVRFSPDFGESEIVADGFRNAYDFDFGPEGEPFAFDSDNERCVSLPWYEPTRFYRVRPGGHHGWLNPQFAQFWRLPPYLFDVERPACTLGRGSPTGVACYRHAAFPEAYRGGFFLADWTFGRIHFVRPRREGSGYVGEPSVFLEAVGSEGFAPTGLAVHPATGDLFVCIGGRGTRGGVYRVRWGGGGAVDRAAVAALQPRRRAEPDRERAASPLDLAPEGAGRGPRGLLDAGLKLLREEGHGESERLAGARLAQLALGDVGSPRHRGNVWEGYSPRNDPPTIPPALRARLLAALDGIGSPRGRALDWEIARLLAMLEDDRPAGLAAILGRLTDDSDPVADIHFLIAASRLKAPRSGGQTAAMAAALLGLDRKLDAAGARRDQFWPLRITELHIHLARKDPRLNGAILAHPEFGRPDHVVLTHAPGFDRRGAAERVLERAESDEDYAWNADLIDLIGSLPADRSRPLLRRLWGRAGLDEAIVPILAREPLAEDRGRFLAGLRSAQLGAVRASLEALAPLPGDDGPETTIALVRLLGRLGSAAGREEADVRHRVAGLLRGATGQATLGDDPRAWRAWLEGAHPDWAARLAGPVEPGWVRRLGQIDWDSGDPGRGRAVFVRVGCAACHNGARAIGPDLAGVAGRFGREDLFRAILDPSRDVSPRYAATAVATRDGRVHQGTIIYDSVDGLILQTGAATTVRIAAGEIEARRLTDASPMPAGLLDGLSDGEIADLDAYLGTPGPSGRTP